MLFKKQHRDKNLTFINGEKRSVRHYFLDQVCDFMDLVIDNNPSTVKTELSRYHTDADRTFVNYCNKLYEIDKSPTKHISMNTINFGSKFGESLKYFYFKKNQSRMILNHLDMFCIIKISILLSYTEL